MTKKKRTNYTQEFKKDAVKLITEQGYTEAGRNLGVNPNLISKWKRRRSDKVTSHGTYCGRYRAKTLMNPADVQARQKKI